jgi:hypothetical protein
MAYVPRIKDEDLKGSLPIRQSEVVMFEGASEETPYLLVHAPRPGNRGYLSVAPAVRNHVGTLEAPWDWRAAELAGLSIED